MGFAAPDHFGLKGVALVLLVVPVVRAFAGGTAHRDSQTRVPSSGLSRSGAAGGPKDLGEPLTAGWGLAGEGPQHTAAATEPTPTHQHPKPLQGKDRPEGVAVSQHGMQGQAAAADTVVTETGDIDPMSLDAERRRRLRQQQQQQLDQRERWAEGADRGKGGEPGGGRGGNAGGRTGGGGNGGGGGRADVFAQGQAQGGGGARDRGGGGPSVVTSTRLRYDWRRVVADLQPLLMAALGPEVAYWRRKRLTCADLAHTAAQLAAAAPDNLRLVLLRNTPGDNTNTHTNTTRGTGTTLPALSWHFLMPPLGAAAAPAAVRLNASGRVRHAWPPLEPAPLGSCDFCHKQLSVLSRRLSRFLGKVAAASGGGGSASGGGGSGRSSDSKAAPAAALPDMLFLVNAADNMQRFGRSSRAPLLSLIKWWPSYELPWWAPADTPTSLGRKAGGGTIQPPPPPEAVAAAASSSSGSNSSNSSSSLADAVAEAVAAFLSRPELDDPLKLPALQSWLRGHVGKSMAGAAGAAVEAVEALPGGGGADDDAAAAAAGAAAAQSGDMAAAAVAELDRMRQRGDMDLDLMLPTMVVVPRALHSYPWSEASDKAFFSGAPFCPRYHDAHGGDICLRPYLAALAAQHPQDLEVRLTAPWQGPLGAAQGLGPPVHIDASPPTPLPDHARWRYLLAADGYTASSRLGALLAGSSAVLKSRSPYVEWYYRLLTPGAHYLEYWTGRLNRDDVLRALAAARQAAAADPPGLQAAVAANRDIAARYLGALPRLVYSQAALLVYHSLWGADAMRHCVSDLEAHLQDLGRPLDRMGAGGGGGWGGGGEDGGSVEGDEED